MPVDEFAENSPAVSDPATRHFTITPDDDADLAVLPRSLYVNTTGDVAIVDVAGTEITYRDVPAGTILPFRAVRVLEETTASVVGWL